MEHIQYLRLQRPWWQRVVELLKAWHAERAERVRMRATVQMLFELSDATRRDIGLAESGRDAWPAWQVRDIERSRF